MNFYLSFPNRMPVTARSVFNPKKQQLSEDDTDKLIAIAFDEKLLTLFHKK